MRRAIALLCVVPGLAQLQAQKETALGERLAAEFRAGSTEVESPKAVAWVNGIASRLGAAQGRNGAAGIGSGESPYVYRCGIVKDDPDPGHEPIVFPGGLVFVPARLLIKARSEEEFAGTLAHALAHLTLRHGWTRSAMGPVYFSGWRGPLVPVAIGRLAPEWERAANEEADRTMSAAGYGSGALDAARRTAFEAIREEVRSAVEAREKPKRPPSLVR
jgi:hypothetical protein